VRDTLFTAWSEYKDEITLVSGSSSYHNDTTNLHGADRRRKQIRATSKGVQHLPQSVPNSATAKKRFLVYARLSSSPRLKFTIEIEPFLIDAPVHNNNEMEIFKSNRLTLAPALLIRSLPRALLRSRRFATLLLLLRHSQKSRKQFAFLSFLFTRRSPIAFQFPPMRIAS
jgi:hypothetical protein